MRKRGLQEIVTGTANLGYLKAIKWHFEASNGKFRPNLRRIHSSSPKSFFTHCNLPYTLKGHYWFRVWVRHQHNSIRLTFSCSMFSDSHITTDRLVVNGQGVFRSWERTTTQRSGRSRMTSAFGSWWGWTCQESSTLTSAFPCCPTARWHPTSNTLMLELVVHNFAHQIILLIGKHHGRFFLLSEGQWPIFFRIFLSFTRATAHT